MLSFLPGPLLLLINLTLFAIDAIVLGSLVVLLGIVRFILSVSGESALSFYLQLSVKKAWKPALNRK